MRRGVLLAFDAQNAKGGVRGRKLVLEFRDDSYVPELAEASTRELLDVGLVEIDLRDGAGDLGVREHAHLLALGEEALDLFEFLKFHY